ncbi:Hypothetical predicted protein [Lynx pardinus]|uniref:Ubiquitin-like domain-containing protein n=1 Tax=Lynx pardinus TaxID=191816 RepID=A0A485NRW8_LYNPA|nr:Hypothetical predicted protein [Lynx pardinus]
MQLFVLTPKLHALGLTGHKMRVQIKARVALLEGVPPGDQVVLPAGTLLEDEAALGQCGEEALSTPEVAGRMRGGSLEAMVPWPVMGKKEAKPQRGRTGDKEDRPGQAADAVNRHFVSVVPNFGKTGPKASS